MGPVLATDGELHQTKTYSHCQWCAKGNGAKAAASNKRKWTNNIEIGSGSNNLPKRSAILSPENLKKLVQVYVGLKRLTKLVSGACKWITIFHNKLHKMVIL